MKFVCEHGMKVPKNLRCNHGYIGILIHYKGRTLAPSFGIHTRESQRIAEIKLGEIKKDILQRKIGIEPELPSKKFEEVANIWYSIWAKEKNPDGTEAHNKESCYKVRWTLDRVLISEFGTEKFEETRSVDIQRWRSGYTDRGQSATTANRYQAVLSSVFSHVEKWVKTERIKPAFKLPEDNPCDAVEMAPSKKRERILTKYEAGKLKNAFMQLNDTDGWEICKMALKSVLSLKDLKQLEKCQEIDILRAKTGIPVNIPIQILTSLNWYGWRTRWEKARDLAGLVAYKTSKNKKGETVQIVDTAHPVTVEFRDLRKTGINWLKGRHDLKLVSEYAGHADIKTTEASYTIKQSEYLEPLARDIESQVDAI